MGFRRSASWQASLRETALRSKHKINGHKPCSHLSTKSGKTGQIARLTWNFSALVALVYNRMQKGDDPWPLMDSGVPLGHDERKISMATFDAVREVRIALTVEDFDQAVQFYRDRLGLAVVEEWQRPEGRGAILSLGPQATLELFDGPQADFVDQVEVGQRVSGPVRLALSVPDADAAAAVFEQAGAQVLSPAKPMPWGDLNARVQTPDGMQITLYQAASAGDDERHAN